MKQVMVVLSVVAVMCCGCFEENNVSLYGNPESDGVFGVRAGTEIAQNLEIGASANYRNGQDEINKTVRRRVRGTKFEDSRNKKVVRVQDEIDDWNYGAHAILRFPMNGFVPYAGAQVPIGNGTWDVGNDIEPLGGVSVGLTDSVSTFAEYQHKSLSGERDKVLFGIRIGF